MSVSTATSSPRSMILSHSWNQGLVRAPDDPAEGQVGKSALRMSPISCKDASYADFLEEVLRSERDRSREMITRMAGFPALKTLEAFTCRSLDDRQLVSVAGRCLV